MKLGALYFRRQKGREIIFRIEHEERRKRITLKPLAELVGDEIKWVGAGKSSSKEEKKDLLNQIFDERERWQAKPGSLENKILDAFGTYAQELKRLLKAVETEEQRDLVLMGLLDVKLIIADEMSKRS